MRRGFIVLVLCLIQQHLISWRREKEESDRLCGALSGRAVILEASSVEMGNGRYRLYELEWKEPLRGPTASDVFFNGQVLFPEQRVRITGRFHCRVVARNPGVVQDGLITLTPLAGSVRGSAVTVPRVPGAWERARTNGRARLRIALQRFSGLRALALSVWFGDTSEFPPGLSDLYREGGLLHILALSGQHVAAFCLLVHLFFRVLAPAANGRWWARRLFGFAVRWLPVTAAALLVLLNRGNEPIFRAAIMLATVRLLRFRGLRTEGLSVACSSVALLLLWDPARASSVSFLLSAGATAFVCALLFQREDIAFLDFLKLTLSMPLLVAPVGAFFFAKVPLMATLNGLLLGWVWETVWIPVGFAVPFFVWILPEAVLTGLEKSWGFFIGLQQSWSDVLTWGFFSVVRPTWLELIVLEVGLCALVFQVAPAVCQRWKKAPMK